MKYYIIAGEASGDLHGANLIDAIFEQDPQAEIRCWGGDKMQLAGGELRKHYKELAFMGFVEVILNLKTILQNFRFAETELEAFRPDVLVLIDYPGFNLRLAGFAQRLGLKIAWYISPQLWAWKAGRVEKIKQYVDRMMVILPFEKDWYAQHGLNVDFVGHPLIDELQKREKNTQFRSVNQLDERPIVALLPGSRKQEISKLLPVYLQMPKRFPDFQFVVAGLSYHETSFYSNLIGEQDVKLVIDATYDLLDHATAACVTSGTATLETALFEVPQVVCYKGSLISYLIGRQLVKVKYISLVNLILDDPLLTELIQFDCTPDKLELELNRYLKNKDLAATHVGYKKLKMILGGTGASQKAAAIVQEMATQKIAR